MVYIQKKKDILWGGATASSQYEGGYDLDGKGLDTQDCRPYLKRTSDATTATRLLTRDVIDEAKKCQGIGNYPFRKGSDGYHHIDEDIALLKEVGLIKKELDGVKVLGSGELTKKLTVKANAFTKSAQEKIETIGGKTEVI